MSDSMITLQGYAGTEPTLRPAGEHLVASFRVAATPRRLNRTTGEWSDGETQWYTVNAWRQLGENVAASVHKGDPIFVHGRMVARTWVNREGVEVTTLEISALVVGHDLSRGRSTLARPPRQDEGDPWAAEVAGEATVGAGEQVAAPAA